MARPAGIPVRTCTVGVAFGQESNADLGASITVKSSEPELVWAATGSPGVSDPVTITIDAGAEASFPLIPTDLTGWLKGGQPVDVTNGQQSHYYTITVQWTKPDSFGRPKPVGPAMVYNRVVIPSGSTPLDLDTVVQWTGVTGQTVSLPAELMSAVTDAQAARDAAQGYAEQAHDISGIDTSDGVVTALVADGGSTTTAQLKAAVAGYISDPNPDPATNPVPGALDVRYSRRLNLVDNLRPPFFIAHRGSSLVYPEHTMEGYRASHAAAWLIEPDLAALSDGTIVAIHDATADRTMNITGNVSSLTRADWDAAYVKAIYPGMLPCKPVYWDQVLDEFGGRNCLVPEIKATDQVTTQAVIDSIVDRGLQGSVIVQSFDYSACLQAVAAGLRVLRLTGSDGPETPAQMVADGIEFVGVSTTVTSAWAQSCVSAGLKLIGWTYDTFESANTRFADGAVGLFSNDPWRISRRYAPLRNRENFDSGQMPPNSPSSVSINAGSGAAGTQRIDPIIPGWSVNYTTMGTGAAFSAEMLLGQFGYGSMTGLTVRLEAQAGPSVETSDSQAANQWIWGLYVGTKPTTGPFVEASGEECYLLVQRRSGARAAFYKAPGVAAASIATTAVPATPYTANAAASSARYEYEISITDTQLIVKNLTLKDPDLVVNHATLRATNAALSLRVKNTNSVISNIRVTR